MAKRVSIRALDRNGLEGILEILKVLVSVGVDESGAFQLNSLGTSWHEHESWVGILQQHPF